uniref:SKA complex subunit 1 n=1 Tax=Callorhinchus milii TaxID=7868 RepID=A0A4W3H785_CALMI
MTKLSSLLLILYLIQFSFVSFLCHNQYHTFKEQEVKEAKDRYFFVEADIKAFTTLKVEKKLHKEVHKKAVRYMLL